MTVLIIGLVLFLGVHLLPMFAGLRRRLVGRMGEKRYKGLFTLVSLLGFGLIIWGFAQAPFVQVYAPVSWGRPLAHAVLPFAFILLAAANMPTYIRSALKHPLLIGVFMWAVVHLLNNGDLRSIILFGSFAAYAVIDIISELVRGKTLIDKPPRWGMDVAAVVGGLVVFYLLARFHGSLFGVPVM